MLWPLEASVFKHLPQSYYIHSIQMDKSITHKSCMHM